MAPVLAKLKCHRHPERPGFATCTSCGVCICQECATTWEGRHCCVDCLAKQRHEAAPRSPAVAIGLQLVVIIAAVVLLPGLASWVLLLWTRLLS